MLELELYKVSEPSDILIVHLNNMARGISYDVVDVTVGAGKLQQIEVRVPRSRFRTVLDLRGVQRALGHSDSKATIDALTFGNVCMWYPSDDILQTVAMAVLDLSPDLFDQWQLTLAELDT